jgi:hypothetical protein
MGWSLPKPRTLNNGAVIARKATSPTSGTITSGYTALVGKSGGEPRRERKHLCAEWVAEIEPIVPFAPIKIIFIKTPFLFLISV